MTTAASSPSMHQQQRPPLSLLESGSGEKQRDSRRTDGDHEVRPLDRHRPSVSAVRLSACLFVSSVYLSVHT